MSSSESDCEDVEQPLARQASCGASMGKAARGGDKLYRAMPEYRSTRRDDQKEFTLNVYTIRENTEESVRRKFALDVLGITAGMLGLTFLVCAAFKIAMGIILYMIARKGPPDLISRSSSNQLDRWQQSFFLPADFRDRIDTETYREMEDAYWKAKCVVAILGIIGGIYSIFMLIFVMCCFRNVLRSSPANKILTATLGIMYGFVVNVAVFFTPTSDVSSAVAGTGLIVVSLWFVARYLSVDVTGCRFWVWLCGKLVIMLIVLAFLPLMVIGPGRYYNTTLVIVNSIVLCLLCFYLVWDFQMIVGGKHRRHQFSLDDAYIAAVQLYIDIVELFLTLLDLISSAKK
ncbi:unnamed protein product [Amoebophrya sp. A25]|nr:unnamed protein product [Amoebophrya sp. A25]|eukprot:GSA25T00000322001.1